MKRIAILLAVFLTTAGCNHKGSETSANLYEHSIFDSILARDGMQERVKKAEQDLPGDVYKTIGEGGVMPMRWNDSRQTREQKIADELLHDLQPSLKQMSVSNLVSAMKIEPWFSDSPEGVAYWLCGEGNKMIIDEIKSRPVEQLEPLKALAKIQKYEVFLNESYSADLGILCQEILADKGIVVRDR
jgi:hypothetical protein